MKGSFHTSRLLLNLLTTDDAPFIMKLVNTEEWIRFIGDRHINNHDEALAYIRKIMENPSINYFVVKTRDQEIPVGIISFIKRDYLPYHDMGFAFLNEHKKQGYAYEAASVVLADALSSGSHKHVLATTIKENTKSIQLLHKLGFQLYKEIEHEGEPLFVFSIAANA